MLKSAVLLALAVVSPTVACHPTPAQTAELNQIENVVLADIKAGKGLPQIEEDVTALLIPGTTGVVIGDIIADAITLLEDLHLFSSSELARAETMKSQAYITK